MDATAVIVSERNAARLAEALTGRAGVDGVRWVLLAPPLRRVLRRELRRLLTDPDLLGACRLHRARLRPGLYLRAWYEVGLTGARTPDRASPSREVAVTWTVAQAGGAGRGDDPGAATEAAALDAGVAAPFRGLESDLPGIGMRLLVWPLDPSHPQLVRMANPRHVHDVLCAAAGPAPAEGAAAAELSAVATDSVRAVRYRPGQRHVLRYASGGSGGGRAVFGKLYRDGDAARAFRVAAWVADRLGCSGDGVSAARPWLHMPADDAVLYGEVAGEPLTRRLGRPGRALARDLALAGVALRRLHETPAPTGLPTFDLRHDLRSIPRVAGRLAPMLPQARASLAAVAERAAALHDRLPGEAPVLAHGDCKADHLWIAPDGAGLTFIDFDSSSLAEPALDLGKFLADLQWWYAGRDPRTLAWAQQRFLEGYASAGQTGARGAPPERLRRARLYEALALARITAHRVRVFDRDWAARTEALTARAAEILTQAVA